MKAKQSFEGRDAILVSMHGKEKVLRPILEERLGIRLSVTNNIDTDAFGAFSGEVERTETPYNAAKKKIEMGFEAFPNVTIAIASEGTFSPHPDAPLITVNSELILLIDRQNDFEIAGREISTETNSAKTDITTLEELNEFAKRVGFPEAGIILKTDTGAARPLIFKDAKTFGGLEGAFFYLKAISTHKTISAETDMRANRNPLRMKNIEAAAHNLVQNILNECPVCNIPGFSPVETIEGLPCGLCGQPTKGLLAYLYACRKCGFRQKKDFPKGKTVQDPMYCDYCNP